MNQNQAKLLELVKKPTVCMLAPSFPIDFQYPKVIGMLKKLGFAKVTELTFGARIVNFWYAEYIKSHPDQKYYITSPCPTCVSLIKNRYPELVQYLVPHVSPMAAMAKIAKKYFKNYSVVFISPCLAKQLIEAPKYKEDIDLVITFKELGEIFDSQGIKSDEFGNAKDHFDSFYEEDTKVYPISGGLAATSHIKNFFAKEQILVADQPKNLFSAFDEIKSGKSHYRFFDILNCPGGCIGGPALINTNLSIKEKQGKILEYQKFLGKNHKNSGNIIAEENLDFTTDI